MHDEFVDWEETEMKRNQENWAFLFIRRRAEQLYSEGQVASARRLLKWVDDAQERRLHAYRKERIPMAK